MDNCELYKLAVSHYENKRLHGKTSLKFLFQNQNNVATTDGHINLEHVDNLLTACIEYEKKLEFLHEHREYLKGDNSETKTDTTTKSKKQDNVVKNKTENTVNKVNIKIKEEHFNGNDVEIIEKCCKCCKCDK